MNTPDFLQLKYITIKINYEPVKVQVGDYVEAKTKDLIAFGYSTLTEESVLNSVRRILNKEKLVDVIDHFVKDDIILEEEKK
jgi:hypothetical protein